MTAFPTITADTSINDAAILNAIVNDLDERWRAAGSPAIDDVALSVTGPLGVWFARPVDVTKTVEGVYGVAREDTVFSGDNTTGPYAGRVALYAPILAGTLRVDAEDGSENIIQSLFDDGYGHLLGDLGNTWQGSWSAETLYEPGDVAGRSTGYYIALEANAGIEPGVSDGWEEVWAVCSAGEINYASGSGCFTFADAVPTGNPIIARYDSGHTKLEGNIVEDSGYLWGYTGRCNALGRHIDVAGVGKFTVVEMGFENPSSPYGKPYVIVQGDAHCACNYFAYSPAGNVLDAVFWATLQKFLAAVVPLYLNSYTYSGGFAGETAPSFYAVGLPDYLEAAGLLWFPRRVRARGPCSMTYDAEEDVTTIENLDITDENPADFVEGHVGHRVDVFGVGQFTVATVESGAIITVAGDAARGHPDTVVSILPDDSLDLNDTAWGYGPHTGGDVLGLWLLFDLIAAQKPLEWTAADVAGFGGGEMQEGVGYMGDPPDDNNLAHAKADAEAAFSACEPQSSSGLGAGTTTQVNPQPWAHMARKDGHGVWSVPQGSDPLVYDIDMYAIAVAASAPAPHPAGTFNGNGDFTVADVLSLCTSDAGCTDRSGVSSAVIGNHTTPPAWPPSDPGVHGYYVATVLGVVKWHFTHEA
jgi:hypothetical protein